MIAKSKAWGKPMLETLARSGGLDDKRRSARNVRFCGFLSKARQSETGQLMAVARENAA
jgi:hypothetical protein